MKLARLCMAVIAIALTSFIIPVRVTEDIYADTGLLSGANDVEVVFDRSGPDAGQGCVCFDVDIWFNSEGNWSTYHFCMSDQETHMSTHVQGPNPTGFAGIRTQPYNIQYGCR